MYMKVEIIDTGCGISQEKSKQLFKLFGKVHDKTQNQNITGIGLGLTIAKRLVDQMGGVCQFKSEIGVGSTFWFCFKI